MLFGSAVVVAFLLGAGGEPTSKRSTAHIWLDHEARPTPFSLAPEKPPIELKSIKVVGASGFGLFAPINPCLSLGAGVTTFKVAPGERATQYVAAIRIRF
jgi:hypothetical protein